MTRMNEILDKPYRDNGAYRVPEGYFSTLNKRIMDALPEEQKQRKGRPLLSDCVSATPPQPAWQGS